MKKQKTRCITKTIYKLNESANLNSPFFFTSLFTEHNIYCISKYISQLLFGYETCCGAKSNAIENDNKKN